MAHDFYRAVFLTSRDGIALVGLDGYILDANPAYLDLVGYSLEEVRKITYQELTPERWHALETDIVRDQILSRGYSDEYEKEYRRKDGTLVPISVKAWLHRDDQGRPSGMWGIVRDCTDRKRSERALADRTAELELVLRAFPDLFFHLDADNRIVNHYATPRSAGAFPPVAGDLVSFHGRRLDEILPQGAASQYIDAVDRVRRSGELTSLEVSFDVDGERRVFEARVLPTSEAHVVVVVRNVTQQHQLEEERRALEVRRRRSQKMEALGQLAGGVAHDFNNLLTAIVGDVTALEREVAGRCRREVMAERLKHLEDAAQRATGLVRQLMTFSRDRAPVTQVLSLNRAVQNMAELLKRLVRENVSITVELDPGTPGVLADSTALDQILVNLAVNASDAMPDGGTLTLATRRRGGVDGAPLEAVLTVVDTGTGMSESVREKIFEPFFTTKPAGTGSGLGLAVVYGTVKRLGGRIDVETAPGRGARFTVTLPGVGDGIESAEAPLESQGPASEETGAGEAILLTEDQESVRRVVVDHLSAQGYRVTACRNAREAREAASAPGAQFDLLLTDLVMPDQNGFELARDLLGVHPHLRVLYMSGYATVGMQPPEGSPAHGFIQKPFSEDQLCAAVRATLRGEPLPAQAWDDRPPTAEDSAVDRNGWSQAADPHDLENQLLLRLGEAFQRDTEEAVARARAAASAGDLAEVDRVLHTLKGTLEFFATRDVTAPIIAIQSRIESGDVEAVRLEMGVLDEILRQVTERIRSVRVTTQR